MVVQASTRSVFGQRSDNAELLDETALRRPINPYGVSKVGADAMAHCYSHLHNMNVNLVRIFATCKPIPEHGVARAKHFSFPSPPPKKTTHIGSHICITRAL